jgi:hypothetical protein
MLAIPLSSMRGPPVFIATKPGRDLVSGPFEDTSVIAIVVPTEIARAVIPLGPATGAEGHIGRGLSASAAIAGIRPVRGITFFDLGMRALGVSGIGTAIGAGVLLGTV